MTSPDIILAITPTCPHCPNAMQTLNELVKKGDIASIQVINIAVDTAFAQDNQIRSVPWLKIGEFVLTGVINKQELLGWVKKNQSDEGTSDYLVETLSSGELDAAIQMVQQRPETITAFISLIADDETNINVRIGIGAVIETVDDQTILQQLLPGLLQLLQHPQARVRGDAAHFLSFIHSNASIKALEQLKDDPNEEVREIVAETLETLMGLE